MAAGWRKNESVAAMRRAAVYLYADDGVTPAPLATTFTTGASGNTKIRQGGTSWADAAGTITNTGIDGHWVYEATQSETNFDGTEFEIRVNKSGFSQANTLVAMNVSNLVWDALKANYAVANSFGEALTEVQSDTNDIQSRLPASLVGGRMRSHIEALDANVITAAAIADNAIDYATLATDLIGAFGVVRRGTAQSGSVSNIRLDGAANGTNDFYKSALIYIASGTGVGQFRLISAYNGTTKDATPDSNFLTAPDGTSVFILFAVGASSSGGSGPTAAAIADAVWDEARSGHVNVGSFGEGVIVNSITANAVNASALATDAVTEIQTGLSTAANLATLQTTANTINTKIGTPASSVSADIAAVQTKLGTPAGASVSADIAAIKTDSTQLGNLTTKVNNLAKAQLGRWKIQGTQLILYEDDGTTPFKTYNLLDDTGTPSNIRIFERVPV